MGILVNKKEMMFYGNLVNYHKNDGNLVSLPPTLKLKISMSL